MDNETYEKYLQSFANMVDTVFNDNPGLKQGISSKEYHESAGLSRSAILDLLRSPLHYKQNLLTPKKPTPAMVVGTAIHTRLIEPHKFDNQYCYEPSIDKRTKAGKEEYAAFQLVNEGKTILDAKQKELIEGIADSFDVANWIEENTNGKVYIEPSIWFVHRGVLCKARPDILVEGNDAIIIVDIKTAKDASKKGFERSIANYGLHIQAAHYTNALKSISAKPVYFYFLVIEKHKPYDYAVYALDLKFYEIANNSIEKAVSRYKTAHEKDVWTGYNKSVQTIAPPVWMEYQAMEMED
jgi:exodeoxyribonuclease VIII